MSTAADAAEGRRNWNSVRVVLEGLILAGILWSISNQTDQTKAIVRLQTQLENIQATGTQMAATIPPLSREVDKLDLQAADHERRITELEQQSQRSRP